MDIVKSECVCNKQTSDKMGHSLNNKQEDISGKEKTNSSNSTSTAPNDDEHESEAHSSKPKSNISNYKFPVASIVDNDDLANNVEGETPSWEIDGRIMELKFKPDFSKIRRSAKSANLCWKDVSYVIKNRKILSNVSGHLNANETCALLGPSGAGKTTLLNILAGRLSNFSTKRVSGTIAVDGSVVNPRSFRRHVSYVVQEDSLFATATARESLEFSARLRLPKSVSKSERKILIDELIQSLGLVEVQNTMCGSSLVRGLSGGEKKRVSIGVELVTNPQLLFLDEPTSGLDVYSAYQVVAILKALSRSGCAILCTIHQPSSEIFSLFDTCLMLSSGQVMYGGKVASLPQNFASAGHPVPALSNPADFLMLLAQTLSEDEMPHITDEYFDVQNTSAEIMRQSSVFTSPKLQKETKVNVFVQLYMLSIREFRNLFRDKGVLIGRFAVSILLNLLFGWIFFGNGNPESPSYSPQTHFGALTNIFISALFGASQPPLLTFPLERIVFLREYSTGTYRATPYFLSKLVVEIPINFASALVIILVAYWMIQLQGNFMILVLEIFLLQIVSASYAFLLGAIVSDVKQAQEFAPLVFVPQLLFTGFFIQISQIPASIQWVQYICSLKYAINLGIITELSGERCTGSNATSSVIESCDGIVNSNDVDDSLVWLYVLILVAIFLVFRTGSLVALIIRSNTFSS